MPVSVQRYILEAHKRSEAELKEFEPWLKLGSTLNFIQCFKVLAGAQLKPVFVGFETRLKFIKFGLWYYGIHNYSNKSITPRVRATGHVCPTFVLSSFCPVLICPVVNFSCPTFVLFCFCPFLLLSFSTFVLFYFCPFLLLSFSIFVLFYFCPFLLLSFSTFVLSYVCPIICSMSAGKE